MAFKHVSDSLSRCDPYLYSDLYDVRKRSDIKHKPVSATPPLPKDTIEISRDKLKEEALSRLRHTSKYVIAQNSFMRIGKYLFLAVAFPPYLLVYGLPKWILVEGIPAVYAMCVWMWKKVQDKTQKQINAGVHQVVQMMNFMQKLVHVLIQPIVRLVLELRQGIHRMQERAQQFFRLLKEKTKTLVPRLNVKEKWKNFEKRFSAMKEKWVQQAQTLATKLQENLQWIKETPQLFLGWGQPHFQRVSQRVVLWSKPWSQRLQTSQKMAERATNWVAKQFSKGQEKFKRVLNPVKVFYRQQLQPRWQYWKEKGQRKGRQLSNFFQQKHKKACVFLQDKQEKLKHLSYQQVVDRFLSHAWIRRLSIDWQAWLKKMLSQPIIRAVGEAGVKAYALCAGYLLQGGSQLLQLLSKVTLLILKTKEKVQTWIKQIFAQAFHFLVVLQQTCRRLALYGLYYFLVGVVMAIILLVWGMRLMGNLTISLTSALNFKMTPGLSSKS